MRLDLCGKGESVWCSFEFPLCFYVDMMWTIHDLPIFVPDLLFHGSIGRRDMQQDRQRWLAGTVSGTALKHSHQMAG